jgi:predicted RecA/RadA family phage recombinase
MIRVVIGMLFAALASLLALNRELEDAKQVCLPVPEGTESGDPLVLGALPCVALIDRNADGEASVDLGGAYRLTVSGEDGEGNAAVGVGDILFIDAEGNITVDEAGTRFGYALDAVAEGEEAVIRVKIGY